ncbi:membrane protein, putative [Syntrophotalea carbinolica DSM 2380]|uniref:Membrane protein, putative n=1 Tax=Syntrophotalea carbinolica (strain DSM 2380 / NBRC 103641 / GraBd1) TaxID=338963 RepID=Q3A6S2_SYNC1|nr:putative sulfate/molybdate transporter [Syntrophotalea carbinolica]ABA87935.1 membrane protein, putative [Syntrophotalea carbinolica DSM 2380]
MRIHSFEFNMRELGGAMGDFGTLFPLAIGYIVVCGVDPTGMLVMMGLANVTTGLFYRLPMPIEPMKVLAVVAIAEQWSPSMVFASAFAMGLVWLFMSAAGVMGIVARITPKSVIRGIQAALGIMLALKALEMMATGWLLALVSLVIVLTLRQNRYAPAAVVLILLGGAVMYFNGTPDVLSGSMFALPGVHSFALSEVWQAMLQAGFSQIPLTATNAVIATAVLIRQYWPDKPVSERKLAFNMGLMNLVVPFFGGMPMCHGSGGLAGQYYFGARTGGANIIEGMLEIGLGLFLGGSIVGLFAAFPLAIVGAMMLLVGIELTKFAKDMTWNWHLAPMVVTLLVAVWTNMAYGFLAGMLLHHVGYRLSFQRSST